MANPNDQIRDKLLRYLYEVHSTARGRGSVAVGIRQIQGALRQEGIKQKQVNSNLDYLVQKDWIAEVIEQRTYPTPQGTIRQSPSIKYKISALGIDRLEAASVYRGEESISHINVTNVSGVTVIGEGNIVNAQFTDVFRALTELENSVENSDELLNEQKLDVIADLASLKAQFSKPKPNFAVIREIWSGVKAIVTGAQFAEYMDKVSSFISDLAL